MRIFLLNLRLNFSYDPLFIRIIFYLSHGVAWQLTLYWLTVILIFFLVGKLFPKLFDIHPPKFIVRYERFYLFIIFIYFIYLFIYLFSCILFYFSLIFFLFLFLDPIHFILFHLFSRLLLLFI